MADNIDDGVNQANALVEQGFAAYQAKDYAQAVELWRKAVDMAPSNAQQSCVDDKSQHGVAHNEGYQDEKRREDFSPSSAPGIVAAMCNLGFMYEKGQGVPQDAVKAAELYRKAAENGNPMGMRNLAELYSKAAKNGSATGMRNLGECYRDGTGVKQDFAEAEQWFNKAIANGDENAKEELAKLKQMMSKKMIEEACEHEWEETGGHAEDTADHLSMIFFTDYKCKLCGKTTDSIDHVHDH